MRPGERLVVAAALVHDRFPLFYGGVDGRPLRRARENALAAHPGALPARLLVNLEDARVAAVHPGGDARGRPAHSGADDDDGSAPHEVIIRQRRWGGGEIWKRQKGALRVRY